MIRVRRILPVLFMLVLTNCSASMDDSFIAVDELGYNTEGSKTALLVNASGHSFEILDAATSNVVYQGNISDHFSPDQSTGDSTSLIEFSAFKEPGRYYIRDKEFPNIKSTPFTIGTNLYKSAALTAIQSYYYNRCGTAVDNGEPWSHPVCHLQDAVFYSDPSARRDVSGGWHDAGDYNKFSVNTSFSVALLLKLYENDSKYFKDSQLDIPESDNGIPDILDEAQWALVWLLKMQNDEGGVYHKVSQKKWIGEFLPQNDPATRYIFGVSSASTAAFAAVTALAARIYEPYERDFSQRLTNASLLAWKYLEDHTDIQPAGGFKNPPDVRGGEYGDGSDHDERSWAAIELYRLTGDHKFLDYFITHYSDLDVFDMPPLSWKNVHSFAICTFLETKIPEAYQTQKLLVLRQLVAYGAGLLNTHQMNNYFTLLEKDEYYWGSASVTLGYSYVLLELYHQTGGGRYKQAVLDQLHYVLGRNPFGKSLVTGVGTVSVEHPYHQFSMKLDYDKPVPGMLVGGANNHLFLNGDEISPHPGKNYEDNSKNYLVNEVAINYTAIFAYIAGSFPANDKSLSTF